MKCRDLQNQPPATRAIVYPVSASGCFGRQHQIFQSFDLAPFLPGLQKEILASGEVANREDILVMNHATRTLFKKAQQAWEAVARVKFVEDKAVEVLVFSYHPTGKGGIDTGGFARLPGSAKRFIGISTYFSNQLDSPKTMQIMLHELGHIAGLGHPWTKQILQTPFQNTTAFSVMNYGSEYAMASSLYHFAVMPVAPMPADIRAMQFIYGANQETNNGNQTYYLQQYHPTKGINTFDTDRYLTISSLPWDASGQDTFSAEGVSQDVVMNIRGAGVSKISHAYVATPYMTLENVVAGDGRHAIVLNALDNHVNITRSNLSLLFFAPPGIGKDTVVGFNPKRDRILLESSQQPANFTWSVSLDTTTTASTNVTLLKFNDHHFVRLIGVHPAELTTQSISICDAFNATLGGIKQANAYQQHLQLARRDQELEQLIAVMCVVGEVTGGALLLSGSTLLLRVWLQKHKLLQNHLALSNVVATSLPLMLTGDFTSAGVTVITPFIFDESYALHFTAGMMLASIAMQSGSITDFALNVVKTGAVAATGFLISKFSFLAYDAFFEEEPPAAQPTSVVPKK